MNSLLCLLCGLAIGHGPGEAVEATTPEQKYEALIRERDEAHRAFLDGVIPGFTDRDYAGGFLALADAHPGTTVAEDALIWICSHTFGTLACEEAKRRLLRDHIDSAKLGPALGYQGRSHDYFEGTEAFFRTILAESPHRELRGLACYWLARHFLERAEGVRFMRSNPDLSRYEGAEETAAELADVYGADWIERLCRQDPEALEREAEALFERVLNEYADIPHNDKRRDPGPLGEVARAYLHELRNLTPGKTVPEIVGVDLDGRPFRLSDYRGQVVVLDFGSHFSCGLCHLVYPRLRAMTERLRDRPFAVVSINAEPGKGLEELKQAWAVEGNTWRCLLDGDWEGPIQRAWNIQSFPTLYVLDGRGVIRYKDQLGQNLEEVVDELLEESAQE